VAVNVVNGDVQEPFAPKAELKKNEFAMEKHWYLPVVEIAVLKEESTLVKEEVEKDTVFQEPETPNAEEPYRLKNFLFDDNEATAN